MYHDLAALLQLSLILPLLRFSNWTVYPTILICKSNKEYLTSSSSLMATRAREQVCEKEIIGVQDPRSIYCAYCSEKRLSHFPNETKPLKQGYSHKFTIF